MFVNLIKKYGVIPKTFMPETENSNNSDPMNALFVTKLREYAKVLRDMNEQGASDYGAKREKRRINGRILQVAMHQPWRSSRDISTGSGGIRTAFSIEGETLPPLSSTMNM